METVIARINDQSPINHEIKKVKVSLPEIFIQTSGSKSRIQILPLSFEQINFFRQVPILGICQLNRPLE